MRRILTDYGTSSSLSPCPDCTADEMLCFFIRLRGSPLTQGLPSDCASPPPYSSHIRPTLTSHHAFHGCFKQGYTEVRYSEEKKRVIYEPLQLTQAFRNFESSSPWEQVGSGVDHRPEVRPRNSSFLSLLAVHRRLRASY